MAAKPAGRHASYDDVLQAADNVVAEVLNGDLYTSPRPAGPHAEAASVLGMDVGGAFHRGRGGPGGWIILFEPELHLARDSARQAATASCERAAMARVTPCLLRQNAARS